MDSQSYYRVFVGHDRRFDGRVFVGVVTTGVYCRPVCRVRPPRFGNCRFYPSAAAAEDAGFRPCMRCRPEASPGTPAWLGTSTTVSRALRLISAGALDEGSEEDLAARLGVSGRHLRRLFITHLGTTPAAVAHTRRVHFARRLVSDTKLPMTEIALSSGFGSIRRFNEAIRASFGSSPTDLRRRLGSRAKGDADFVLKLAYRPPFDREGLFSFLAARAIPGVESVEAFAYRRTIEVDGTAGMIEVRALPEEAVLALRVRLSPMSRLIDIAERVRRLFDLEADPMTIAAHLGRDRRLRDALAARQGVRVPGAWDGFELAVRAVLGQQVSVRGATTLSGRLVRLLGTPLPEPEGGLTHLFPGPEALARANLSRLGVPRARAEALKALARAVADGAIRFDGTQDPAETQSSLTALPGIGPWTAGYIAMRALGEPDAFPAGDLGLRRALATRCPLTAQEMEEMSKGWQPWRAYAAMLLWLQESAAAPTKRGENAA